MSNAIDQPTAEVIRMRIETLRNYHYSVVRSGEQRLRAAMADYALQFGLSHEREATA